MIASVYPLGTEQQQFSAVLADCVKLLAYDFEEIRLSDTIRQFETPELLDSKNGSDGFRSAFNLMNDGNYIRTQCERGDALALLAISMISAKREALEIDGAVCYYIRSLKHPDEIETLRKVYGSGFFLVGLHSEERERMEYLTEQKGMSNDEAAQLLTKDQAETNPYGQKTRKTFEQADFFLKIGSRGEVREQLQRILDLIFGYPFHTPTKDEYGMFMAYAASLRSADLSRQVGASIFSGAGDIIAMGCNDVPKSGGGLYWPADSNDAREFKLGYDSNEKQKNAILVKLVRALPDYQDCEDEKALLDKGAELFGQTGIQDLTEFGRTVHAEMDALLSAARIGAGTRGAIIYTTTFPCHNCAKHIVAAGIKTVKYVEPYPKSLAIDLHSDSIHRGAFESDTKCDRSSSNNGGEAKVNFEPFIGVAARRYTDLFSMGWSNGYRIERKTKGKITDWRRSDSSPRVPMAVMSYTEQENSFMQILKESEIYFEQDEAED